MCSLFFFFFYSLLHNIIHLSALHTGMVVFAIASFACTVPHFIYGEALLSGHMKLSGGAASAANRNSLADLTGANRSLYRSFNEAKSSLCHEPSFFENRSAGSNSSSGSQQCSDDLIDEQNAQSDITSIVLLIFTVSLLAIGVGQTAVSTLGIPYIDDNVASRESPIYIGNFFCCFFY